MSSLSRFTSTHLLRRTFAPSKPFTSTLARPRTHNFIHSTRPRWQLEEHTHTVNSDDEVDLKLEDDGTYNIIVPADPLAPLARTTSPRSVPPHIMRPPYAPTDDLKQRMRHMRESIFPQSSIIPLGGEPEHKLRQAARLAEKTLVYAGTLVQVSVLHRRDGDKAEPYRNRKASRRTRSTL